MFVKKRPEHKTSLRTLVSNTIGSPKIGVESFILMIEYIPVSTLFDLTRALIST